MRHRVSVLVLVVLLAGGPSAVAQSIPALNSRPGAAYTLYLNFGGFTFTGTWGGTVAPSGTPGTTPAYDTNGNPGVFTATETTQMQQIWSRSAELYAPFNVNVTTVTPAGTPAGDFNRQAFYDQQARFMHMVIGGTGSWIPGPIGVSFVDVASDSFGTTLNGQLQNSGAGAGLHTNWTFPGLIDDFYADVPQATALVSIHENGHALALNHQSVTETATRGAIMSAGLRNPPSARNTWVRTGGQNDMAVLVNNPGMGGYIDDGIGNTRPAATPLPVVGTTINADLARGVITPVDTINPNPLGEANYTTDFFSFIVGPGGANVSVTLNSGRSTLTPGTADPGATLDATLRLLDVNGVVLQTANTGTFTETITVNGLAPGAYFFQISSAGASGTFFDVGSFFLTGSIVPVPEPAFLLTLVAAAVLSWRAGRSPARP